MRFSALPPIPGTVLKEAQGLVGGDFECATSILPGVCAYRDAGMAAAACANSLAANCTALVVFARGLDGCSAEVALLKQSNLAPANAFMAPTGRRESAHMEWPVPTLRPAAAPARPLPCQAIPSASPGRHCLPSCLSKHCRSLRAGESTGTIGEAAAGGPVWLH